MLWSRVVGATCHICVDILYCIRPAPELDRYMYMELPGLSQLMVTLWEEGNLASSSTCALVRKQSMQKGAGWAASGLRSKRVAVRLSTS